MAKEELEAARDCGRPDDPRPERRVPALPVKRPRPRSRADAVPRRRGPPKKQPRQTKSFRSSDQHCRSCMGAWLVRPERQPAFAIKCDKALVRCALQPTKRRQRRGTAGRSGAGRRGGAERGGEQQREQKHFTSIRTRAYLAILARVGPLTWPCNVGLRSWINASLHEPQLHVTLYQKPSPSPRDTERWRAGTQNR